MIRKITLSLALFIGLLTCSLEGQFKCVTPGAFPFGGGVVQPFVSNPGFNPNESQVRQRLTIDERIQGSSAAPAGGVGLMQSWSF
jgi:hypothetical protein